MTKAFALKNSMKAFFQGVILKKPTKLVRQLLQFNYILKHSSFSLRLADWQIFITQYNLKKYLIINNIIITFASYTQIACADIF